MQKDVATVQLSQAPIGYLPFLDGLRAISIILVISYHGLGPITANFGNRFLNGWAGVDIFFVISGFLITSILLHEQAQMGHFHVKRFYLRRWFRISPAYYCSLIVISVLSLFSGSRYFQLTWISILMAGLYLTDFDLALYWGYTSGTVLTITWSLAIEEQFYLLWPWFLKFSKARALESALFIIVLVAVWRVMLICSEARCLRLINAFDTKIDSVLIGCVTAIVWRRQDLCQKLAPILGKSIVPNLLIVSLLCSLFLLGRPCKTEFIHSIIFWLIQMPAQNLITALLILTLCLQPEHRAARLLSCSVLVWLGRLSYSLYLYHPLGAIVVNEFARTRNIDVYVTECLKVIACIAFASASYYGVERPFLRKKIKFSIQP